MKIEFESCSENEAFARTVIAAYITRLNPTLEELSDVKTAVSEAVTNCIIHGYDGGEGTIHMECSIDGREVTVKIEDYGVGIEDIDKAMEPLYTTKPEWERSGMGFAFMDELQVESVYHQGTKITMKKTIGKETDSE